MCTFSILKQKGNDEMKVFPDLHSVDDKIESMNPFFERLNDLKSSGRSS